MTDPHIQARTAELEAELDKMRESRNYWMRQTGEWILRYEASRAAFSVEARNRVKAEAEVARLCAAERDGSQS